MEQGVPGSPLAMATVVVVDDDDATLLMISTFLRRHGYHVVAATNPVRALEIVRSQRVDLLITDWMMPHVDGITLTEQVHQLPGLKDLPVILITAHSTEEVVNQSMRRGVALTLAKPLELARLLDLVGFATAPAPPPT
jgi:two-component system, chemotaxis family, chemotaxis protein CheY